MTFFPEWTLAWDNAFWFTLVALSASFVLALVFPRDFRKRVFTMPKFESTWGRIAKRLNMFCLLFLLGLPLLTPIRADGPWFVPGVVLFFAGLVFYVAALLNYASTDPDRPVVKGVYRFSRNPQQMTTIMMWIGVGLATGTLLFICICLLQLVLAYPTFLVQEEFCIARYGQEYRDYMEKTPRYALFI